MASWVQCLQALCLTRCQAAEKGGEFLIADGRKPLGFGRTMGEIRTILADSEARFSRLHAS